MKKPLLLLSLLIFFTACGGGGGSSPSPSSDRTPTTTTPTPPPPPQSIKITDTEIRTPNPGDTLVYDASLTVDEYAFGNRIASGSEDTTLDVEIFSVDKTSIVPGNPDIFGDLTPLLFRQTFGDGTTSDIIQVYIPERGVARVRDSRGFFYDATDLNAPLNGLVLIPDNYDLNASYTRRFVIVGDDLQTPRYTGEVTVAIGSTEVITSDAFDRIEVARISIELVVTATDDYWFSSSLDVYKSETEQVILAHPGIGTIRSDEKTSLYNYRSSDSPDVIAYFDLELRSVNFPTPAPTDD